MSEQRQLSMYPQIVTQSDDALIYYSYPTYTYTIAPTDNSPDLFTEKDVDYADCSDAELKKMLQHDARDLMQYVFEQAQPLQQRQGQGNEYYIITLEPNSQNAKVFQQLELTIKCNCLSIPEGINLQLNNTAYNRNSNNPFEILPPAMINPNADNVRSFDALLSGFKTYAKGKKLSGVTPLSLEEQIDMLTAASDKQGAELDQLTAWKNCLRTLLQDAGNDQAKREKVSGYVKATQAILRNPEDTELFTAMIKDLSAKAKTEDFMKAIVEQAVLFLLAVTLGVILFIAAANPISFGVVITGLCLLLPLANYYNSETNEGRLSEGISNVLGKVGLFKFTTLKETAQELVNRPTDPNNDQPPADIMSTAYTPPLLTPVYV